MLKSKLFKNILSIFLLGSILFVISFQTFALDGSGYIYELSNIPCQKAGPIYPSLFYNTSYWCVGVAYCDLGDDIGAIISSQWSHYTCPNVTVNNLSEIKGEKWGTSVTGHKKGTTIYGGLVGERVQVTDCGSLITTTTETNNQDACNQTFGDDGGGYETSVCDYVTGFDQFGQPCGDNGGSNCDFCQYNWETTAACSGPYDRNYCGY